MYLISENEDFFYSVWDKLRRNVSLICDDGLENLYIQLGMTTVLCTKVNEERESFEQIILKKNRF